jgi:LmbE family N-acetylglucosaminyl deacetylase
LSLRLLCVIAHPDDECYAFGGALALAADRGVEVSVVCLTDGQAATNRGESSSSEDLGRIRRQEFAASCKVLGVAHHELLEYQDGKLEFTPLSELAGRIVSIIRTFRPHVVLTFGADGAANTHPDHTSVSAATTAAFHWSGHPKRYPELGPLYQPQRLFHQTTNFFLPDRHKPLPLPSTLTLDITSVYNRKIDAFRAHPSQLAVMEGILPLFEHYGKQELYTLVATPTPTPATQSTDMFEGIMEEENSSLTTS